MNKKERIIVGTFFSLVIVTAVAVIASNAGFIPESVCFWVVAVTSLVGVIGGGIVMTGTGSRVDSES